MAKPSIRLPREVFVLRTLDGELYRSQIGLWCFTCFSTANRKMRRMAISAGSQTPVFTTVVKTTGAYVEQLRTRGEQLLLDDTIIPASSETAQGAPYA